MKEILQSWPAKDVAVIVFSDGERILGARAFASSIEDA